MAEETAAPPDAINLLERDHRLVDRMFAEYEDTEGTDAGKRTMLVGRMIEELSAHADIEERILYPLMRDVLPDGDEQVSHAIEEHDEAKQTMARLEDMTPSDDEFDGAVRALIEAVRHHVEEEESELFTRLRESVDAQKLAELAAELEAARATAPLSPTEEGVDGTTPLQQAQERQSE